MPALPQLDAEEQRILGVLLEKQVTVPASYPMSLSAVRTGCNQSSSRDPIVDYDEPTVEATLRGLKDRQLVRIVWADKGRRTLKYHQLLSEVLELNDAEKALVTVLLLRGAQAPGELRTRTDRLHGFAERGDVEVVLADLAARPEPLVRELPRQRGQHDNRWVHLLGDVPVTESVVAEAAPAVDREAVLAAGAEARDQRVRSSYDAVATAYADHLVDELIGQQPFETWLLDRVAAHADGGPVVEVGCGPGHVTAYLAEAGARRLRHRPLTRDGRRGQGPVPRGQLRGGGPAPADATDVRRGLGRGARVVLPHPPRRVRAPRRAGRAHPPLVARRLAGRRAARRVGGPAPRELVRRAGRPRLRPARSRRGGGPGRGGRD